MAFVKQKQGPEWFDTELHKAASKCANSLKDYFKAEPCEFMDEKGNWVQREVAYTKDASKFLTDMGVGRGGVKKEKLVFACDKGKFHH